MKRIEFVFSFVVICLLWQGGGVDNFSTIKTVPVVIRSGWTLSEIAQGTGMSLSSLMNLNKIQNPDDIYPEEVLKTYPYSDWQEVVVSWYEDGTTRADGQPFDPNDPTVVAHKWLPFGTRVKLTREDNGQSIVVVVRDRGPYVAGRDFDLSRGAAQKLGIFQKGIARCTVEIMSSPE